MLRISKLADYATVVMVYMARVLGAHSATDIAVQTHLGLPTVSKILKMLAKHKLLISQRGAKGGYQLAKPIEEITMAEIISAIDGQTGMTECHEPGHCQLEPICSLRSNWYLLSHAMLEALQAVSLKDMARPIIKASVHLEHESIRAQI